MKKGWIRGMIAGAMLGASAATVYGMMNWEQERRNPPVYVINMMRTILQYKGMFGLIQEIQQYLSR